MTCDMNRSCMDKDTINRHETSSHNPENEIVTKPNENSTQ